MKLTKEAFRRYWEGQCRRCGMCCHEKYIVGSTVVYAMDEPCTYLIESQNSQNSQNGSEETSCAVYETRTEICSRCRLITPWKAMFSSYLPPQCGYVKWAEHHHVRFALKRHCIIKRS